MEPPTPTPPPLPVSGPQTPIVTSEVTIRTRKQVSAWTTLAEKVYEVRSPNYRSNHVHIEQLFQENEELVEHLMIVCPNFKVIFSYILEDRLGFWVKKVDWTKHMKDWGLQDCKRVGCSLATFIRKRKTGEAAVSA